MLKFLNIDSNLATKRLDKLPVYETLENEMTYIREIDADVILHRE